jgi:formate dehydrogenase subunit gamma
MELFRYTRNVWGQEMLVGMSWELLWVPVAAALGFIVAHQIWRLKNTPSD